MSRWLILAALVACHHGASSAPEAGVATLTTAPTPSASHSAAVVDAAKPIGPEERKAYAAAVLEGRKQTLAKKYPEAIAAFTRALAAIPGDGRATSERGYARFLAKDYDHANEDFWRALGELGDGDKALLAQVEYNLGLVAEARGRPGDAAAHFHRSYDLNPTPAAKARMGACPASTSVPSTTIYASEADARAKLTDLDSLDTAGTFQSVGGTGAGTAVVLVPIDGGKLAGIDVGLLGMWRCGTLGEVAVDRDGGVWKITYQAHRGVTSPGICACDDGVACNSDSGGYQDPSFPKCKCDAPLCPLVCGGADLPEGRHIEAWIDAHTGAGIGAVEVDHEYLDELKIEADVAKRSVRVTGLGCR